MQKITKQELLKLSKKNFYEESKLLFMSAIIFLIYFYYADYVLGNLDIEKILRFIKEKFNYIMPFFYLTTAYILICLISYKKKGLFYFVYKLHSFVEMILNTIRTAIYFLMVLPLYVFLQSKFTSENTCHLITMLFIVFIPWIVFFSFNVTMNIINQKKIS